MCYIHFELYNKSIHDDDFKLLSKEVLYHLFIVLSQMLVTPGHSELLYSVNFLDIINIICEKMFCNMKNDIDVISKISDVERIRDVVTCVKRHLIADGGFYFEFLKGNYIHLEIAVELGKKK
jgi:hypothetical protein